MKITFLGTNGWYNTATGNTVCILIESMDYYVILDAGNGFYKLDRYLTKDNPVFLLLSHFHLDHIYGLHTLVKFSFNGGLKVFGPEGIKDILELIANDPFSVPMSVLPFDIEAFELPKERGNLPFEVECIELSHASLTLGYRLGLDGKLIAYCPDTGYCENAVKVARGADLLISECSFRPGEHLSAWPHLNPQQASEIARDAKVKQLVLTHFDASRYRTMESRKEAEAIARETFPNTIASRDDMQIRI
jgi:ribonuclease BN (tRNA processing enzyme)